jgi:hypothetical protein
MSKLFSAETPEEYKEKIQSKMDEAHENGCATLDEDGEKLQFADVDGDIIVEDQTDGMNEVTRISQNPENENDFIMSEVEIPAETSEEVTEETVTEPVVEETVTESDNLESIEIKRIPGPDGAKADDIVEDLDIEVKTGIENEEKSGTDTYSFKFKNFSQKKAQIIAKIFAHCADCIDDVVKSANVDEDVQVKFDDGQMKIMSVTFGKPVRTFSMPEEETAEEKTADLTEVIDAANKLVDLAEGGITKENADEVKTLAEEVIGKAEAVENDEVSLKSIKSMCSKFSEEAAAVADAEEVVETPTEETVVETPADETPAEETTVEETVTESNANPQVKQCEETGKWYIEEDPEKKLYDTQEEANEVAARMFSDPKVTVTIEDLEPASVSELLGGPKAEEETELEPAVDPNEGLTNGRHFSMTATGEKKYDNPLLFTEIN